MSLNSSERRSLAAIEEGLSASAPELESLLAMFNGLTAGEDMPAHTRMRRLPRLRRLRQMRLRLPRLRRPRRRCRQPRTRNSQHARRSDALQRWWHACLALWVIFFVGMVATAVALSSAGPQRCQSVRAAGCSMVAQAHGLHPAPVERV